MESSCHKTCDMVKMLLLQEPDMTSILFFLCLEEIGDYDESETCLSYFSNFVLISRFLRLKSSCLKITQLWLFYIPSSTLTHACKNHTGKGNFSKFMMVVSQVQTNRMTRNIILENLCSLDRFVII